MSFLLPPIKNKLLGLCVPLLYYFGLLPEIPPDKSRNFKAFYAVYICVIYIIAIFCHSFQVIKFCQIITDDIFIFSELIRNFTVTWYHFTSLVKCIFLRSERAAKLFKRILNYEKMVYESGNDEIIDIYEENLSSTQVIRNFYVIGILLADIFYSVASILKDPYYISKGNETIIVKQLPLSAWTPLEDNYLFSYIWTSSTATYLSTLLLIADLTCYSLIMSGICQINILNHFISNFYKYSNYIKQKEHCTKEESYKILQKELTKMHQEVISYVKTLNDGLKYVLLLEFAPCSIQLAAMIYEMVTNVSIIQCILLGNCILILITKIFNYCNSAHILAMQSQSVANAWYDIDWTELPYNVRRNIVLCIIRAQKPLYITIGDMGIVSLNAFLRILKETYSYLMLLTTI